MRVAQCEHVPEQRYCDECRLALFVRSVSEYRGLLMHLPPLEPYSRRWLRGPEHLHFVHNLFHAMLLRKYVSEDDTSLRKVLASLRRRAGWSPFTDDEEAVFRQEMKKVETAYTLSFTQEDGQEEAINGSEMVKAFLYGSALHAFPEAGKAFSEYPASHRAFFPAALVAWLEQVSYRVIEMDIAVRNVSLQMGWGIDSTPTHDDPAFVAQAMLKDNAQSDMVRRTGEYIARRNPLDFTVLALAMAGETEESKRLSAMPFSPDTSKSEEDGWVMVKPRPVAKPRSYEQPPLTQTTQTNPSPLPSDVAHFKEP